jgi:hypothetical protein
MNSAIYINTELVRQWLERNADTEMIRDELISLGHDPDTIEAHVREFVKVKLAKRQSVGFKLLASGAILGFASCVLTIVNPLPSFHDLFLYGLTSISILFICSGLYLVFE